MSISDREKLVLNAIVDYYLTVGDTIGSRTLVKKYGIELSSATIRNVMADLEDMGFIEKTHTSSGRIPTDMGYKYYLTELLKIERITQEEIENINNVYNRRIDELENVLKKTSNLLPHFQNLIYKNSLMPSSILLASRFFIKLGRKTRNIFYEKVV